MIVSCACRTVIDPTIEQDLRSQTKPWALSPLVATMPYCSRTYVDEEKNDPLRRPRMLREMSLNSLDGISPNEGKRRKRLKFDSSSHRQKYFRDPERRKEVEFGPGVSFFFLPGPLWLASDQTITRRLSRLIFAMDSSSSTHPLLYGSRLACPLTCQGIGISTQ